MMWLKKKLRKWVNDARKDQDIILKNYDNEPVCDDEPILNFRVFGAVGGQVVEFRRYDRKSDRSNTTTYIITKDQDFGEKIAKIANLELLK